MIYEWGGCIRPCLTPHAYYTKRRGGGEAVNEAKKHRFSALSNEQLIELLRLSLKGTSDSLYLSCLREEIVSRNIGLVKSIAVGFLNSGEPLDDLIQAGYMGLLNAVANFDLARNTRFSTYASHLIKGEIRHYIRDKHSTIRIPQWVQVMNRKVKEAEEAFFKEEGYPPPIAELANCLDISESQLVELLRGRKAMTYISIDQERRSVDPNPSSPDITHFCSRGENLSFDFRMRIIIAIEELAEIKQQVIDGLFYQGKSQTEVGKELGVSQRQVSRMKEQILREMKGKLAGPHREEN